jgi:hypothetical protein
LGGLAAGKKDRQAVKDVGVFHVHSIDEVARRMSVTFIQEIELCDLFCGFLRRWAATEIFFAHVSSFVGCWIDNVTPSPARYVPN